MTTLSRRFFLSAFLLGCFAAAVEAQPSRVVARIDNSRRVTLAGRVHPRANARNDRGAVQASMPLPGMTLMLKPSASQRADLAHLVASQQDPASADFHKWLTPSQFADRFGASQDDVDRIVQWLQSQGFSVGYVSPSRTWIGFSGSAEQARNAFQTQIHRYDVNGVMHYANATDPTIPTALAGIVAGIRGLSDFRLKPRVRPAAPEMLAAGGFRALAPDDFATIYDVAPLYSKDGLDGTGQAIAIVGQSNINVSDSQKFRTTFNLPAQNLTPILVPSSTNPGIVPGDVDESNLDIEWAGAVARNAEIRFYYANNVWDAAYYAIDDNKAKVLTMSYGACELMDLVDLPSFQSKIQQANAQGMTFLAASGDNGAADCDDPNAAVAQNGLAVDVPSAIPEVTGMGGTEFSDQSDPTQYWSSASSVPASAALSYIPEIAWNNSFHYGDLSGTGGGTSIYFPQPGWQTGPGVPSDGFRHVPDISLASSSGHVPYYVYTSGAAHYYGGTSVASPTMAGIFALLNQYLVNAGQTAGLGNANPQLYRMAANPATYSEVFHDITSGDNKVPCTGTSPNCSSTTPGVNGTVGYSTAANYDMVTGLGSVNAYNLVHQWSTALPQRSSVVPSIDSNPVTQQNPDASGNRWRFTITLTEEAGVPTRLTDFTIDGLRFTAQIAALFGASDIPARQSISAAIGLANVTVPKNVLFAFSGVDAGGTAWTTQMSIPFTGPDVFIGAPGFSNAASGQQIYAPGMLMSIYGSALGNTPQSAGAIPLPTFLSGFSVSISNSRTDWNPAPLYYVSPNQVNVQIPYEVQPGTAYLVVSNPYQQSTRIRFTVQQTAPGIFMFLDGSNDVNPSRQCQRLQTCVLFITGAGQVSPSVPTGDAPSASTPVTRLPKPVQPVSMTIGGVAVTGTDLPFVGVPSWSVGVTQINFRVPADAPLGSQKVIVTVGGVDSLPANIRITQ